MTAHEPERDAAAYVGGVMTPEERERFEEHLLSCEACWREVRVDREGRRLAESARESAPDELRASVIEAVLAAGHEEVVAPPGSRGRATSWWQRVAFVAAVLALVVAAAVARTVPQPPVIAAAMAAYEDASVEAHHEAITAPDLGALGVSQVGAIRMALANMDVEAFAYRSPSGSRLTLFMADESFPQPASATSTEGGWRESHGDMELMSGAAPVPFLAVSTDQQLLSSFEQTLYAGTVQLA
jgi:anti-sigma factor RsiW